MTYKKLLFAFLLLIALSGVIAGISLYYQPEQSTLGLLIIIGAALLGSATFIGGLNDTYDLLGKLFTRNHPESKETSPKEIYQVSSKNQAGGITVGHVGTININDTQATGSNTNTNQLQKDEQTALLYQTEISVFLHKFKTCLHWTLPLGKNTDKEIDGAFNYGVNFAKAIDLDKISKDIIIKLFSKYDFAKPMANFQREDNFRPTGFNNLLGILLHLKEQIEKLLNKYGGSTSTELTSQIEYALNMIQSAITSLRLDLRAQNRITTQTISLIADLILLICKDFQVTKEKYTKNIDGGFPVLAGKVIKSHKTDGEISVETQFAKY